MGEIAEQTYAAGRVNQELAKEGISLPFGNCFWASNWPTQRAPLPGLILHLIPSVSRTVSPDQKKANSHRQDHCYHRPSRKDCISFCLGCRRVPGADNLPVHHPGAETSIASIYPRLIDSK
jgi:hypothetical protein